MFLIMVCEVKVNAIKTLMNAKVIDDSRVILNETKFEKANEALTNFAIDRYGLETNGQLLFDTSSKKVLDERNSTYYRDSFNKIDRAVPNEALFEQLQILKTNYDNAKAIADQSIIPDVKRDEQEEITLEFNSGYDDNSINLDIVKNGTTVGAINYKQEGDIATVDAVEVNPAYRNQGIAIKAYEQLHKSLQRTNTTLRSGKLNESSTGVWESLVRRGLAKKLKPGSYEYLNYKPGQQLTLFQNDPSYMRMDDDLSNFTLFNNAFDLKLSGAQIDSIYDNYVKLMDRKREGKAIDNEKFNFMFNHLQVFNYKDTYIFGEWDIDNNVFKGRLMSSPNIRELFNALDVLKNNINFAASVPSDIGNMLEKKGFYKLNVDKNYNFRGEDMIKNLYFSSEDLVRNVFKTDPEKVTLDQVLKYDTFFNYKGLLYKLKIAYEALDFPKVLDLLKQIGIYDYNAFKLYKKAKNNNISKEEIDDVISEIIKNSAINRVTINKSDLINQPKIYNELNTELNKTLAMFLSKFGIKTEVFEEIQDKLNIDSFTHLDILNKLIYVNKNNQEDYPQQAGKLIAYMMQFNPMVTEIMNNMKTSSMFKNLSKDEMLDAVGDLIAEALHNRTNTALPKNLLESLKNLIRQFFNFLVQAKINRIYKKVGFIADNILIQNEALITQSTFKPGSVGKKTTKVSLEQALKEDKFASTIVDKMAEHFILTGSVVLAEQGTIYRPEENQVHDLDWVSSLSRQETIKLFRKLYPNNQYIRNISSGSSVTDTWLICPDGYKIINLKIDTSKKVVENGVEKGSVNKILGYDIADSKGNIVSSYVPKSNSHTGEIEAKLIDIFTYENPSPEFYDAVEKTLENGTKVNLSTWQNVFKAKLEYARLKDIWDYNRFIPDSNINKIDAVIPFVNINLDVVNNATSKEVGEVLAKKLAAKMKIDFANVTPQEAQKILENSSKPYMGEPAFYFAGTVYFVGANINARTVLHEFSHPIIQGIRRNNPELFENLFAELSSTTEGQAIINHVKKLYPELGEDTPLFKEEALVYALQLDAITKINNQIQSEGYQSFMSKLLAALKQFLRGIFGTAVKVKDLDSTTTISRLGDMLLSDEEIDLDGPLTDITEQDLVMYYKDVVERADDLLKNSSPEAAQAIINQVYINAKSALTKAREFNTGKDTVNKAMLERALLKEGTTELLPAVAKSLKGFQDIIPTGKVTAEEVIANAVNAEEKIQEMTRIKAVALVNSIDRIKSSSINTLNELKAINKNASLINNRNIVALLGLYKSTANSWMNLIDEINNILGDYPIETDNPFYQTVNEVLNNSKMIIKKVAEIYKKNNVQFFVEITGYMTKFVEEQLNSNLKIALKNLPADEIETEVSNVYNKVINGTIQDSDLEALYNKGVPRDVINRFIDQYNMFVINEDKISDLLSGKTKDVSWFNRWLESYSSSNDPIVGSLAMFIQNEKTDVENQVWNKSQIFRNALSKILPEVNFSKINSTQMRDMVASKDTIFYIDQKTGQPVPKEVWTFLNEFGNGWRFEKDKLEYEYAEAKDTGDKNKIAEALDRLRQFNKAYMWQEFVPEFYEKDDIFNSSGIGKLAYLAKKNAFDDFLNTQNQFEKELERFENYSAIEQKFRTYQQLFSLYYEDGTPKVDDPANGNYDKSIAEILIQHRNETSEFYEWVPIPNSLSTAYNEFVTELEAKNIKRGTEKFEEELRKWEKQNIKIKYSDEFYERRSFLFNRLTEIQKNMKENMNLSFDVSAAYKTVSDLIFTYKDEFGQPDINQIDKKRLEKIKDLEQEIINFRSTFDSRTGLSKQDSEMLSFLLEKSRVGSLDRSEADKLNQLIQMQKDKGIDVEMVEEMLGIFSSLVDLSSKVPTEYYLDALNMKLSKYNVAEVTETTVDTFINSEEFLELLDRDDELSKWFALHHVVVNKYEKGVEVQKFQRTSANSVIRPTDGKYFETTTIKDEETGQEITLLGVPNVRHSRREVKNKYRTIPRGSSREDFIGKYVDNKGDFLPRRFDPTSKYSAVDSRFMDKRYEALKANPSSPEFRLLELIKEHHLEMQKGGSSYGKLYLDVPRYAIKSGDYFQLVQRADASNIKENAKEWLKQKFGKSTQDYLNDLNYDADNNLVNTDLNGDEISYIPVTGIFNIDADTVDADIFNSIFRYGLSLQSQSQLYKSLPLVQSVLSTLEDPANQPKNLQKKSKQLINAKTKVRQFANLKTETYNRLEQVRSLVEREYYGKKVSDAEEANPRLTKWLSSMSKWSSRSSLLMNIPSDLKNQFSGYVQTIIESTGGRFITARDLALSSTWATKAMIDWTSSAIYTTGPGNLSAQLIQIFDPNFKTTDQYGNTVYRSMVKDLMNFEWTYMHRKFGEMDVAMRVFGAFLYGQKLEQTLVNGEKATIRYVDAWETDENGVARLKPGIHPGWSNLSVYHTYSKGESLESIAKKYNITVEELKAKNKIKSEVSLADGQELIISKSEYYKLFKNRLQGTSRALFGAYDDFGQAEGNKLLLYRMFFFMRKWFTPMFVNRFGAQIVFEEGKYIPKFNPRYDWALGKTTKGYYISGLQTLVKVIKSKGLEYQFLNEEEKSDFRRASAEGLMIVMSSLLASLLFGYEDDDEDRWKKIKARSGAFGTDEFNTYGFLTNHALLLLLGVQAETSAFVPLPAVRGVNLGADDYAKLLTSVSTAFNNTVLTYMEILGDVLNFVTFDDAGKYKRDTGPYWFQKEGEFKIYKRLLNALGFSGGTGDPETLIKNLERSGSRIR